MSVCPACRRPLVWSADVLVCAWRPCERYGLAPTIAGSVVHHFRSDPQARALLERAKRERPGRRTRSRTDREPQS